MVGVTLLHHCTLEAAVQAASCRLFMLPLRRYIDGVVIRHTFRILQVHLPTSTLTQLTWQSRVRKYG